jgi:hypothetical protein
MARGFIPFSLEVDQDYPSFASEMSTLLAAGYDELLVNKFTQGSGTGEPRGILTALSANTNVRVVVTSAPTLGQADPYKVWKALPQKFRRRARWHVRRADPAAVQPVGCWYRRGYAHRPAGLVRLRPHRRQLRERPRLPAAGQRVAMADVPGGSPPGTSG